MYKIRHKDERGKSESDWLDSSHTFSFADYYDPRHMGFSDLRVINDDYITPGAGFGTHPHKDMEIISVVLEGALQHRDSMGNGTIIKPGEIQKMSAGTGILHSEFNPSGNEITHFLQIWIYPATKDLEPSYQQKAFDTDELLNRFRLVAAPDGRDNAITISQDVELYETKLESGETITFQLPQNRKIWIHAATGKFEVHGEIMEAGDGMAITDENGPLEFKGMAAISTILLFNLQNQLS